MAIKVGQAFERTSAQPIDTTLTLTKAQMKTVNDNLMPDYYFTICQEDGKIYLYDKSKTNPSAITGKFDELQAGGGEDTPFVYFSNTPLEKTMNLVSVVEYSELETTDATHTSPTTADLIVGKTLVYDEAGTMGIITQLDDVSSEATITTATTSTPTKELTQAEYDALTEAEKKNGTIYFITDNYVGSTYVGAYETIYSTTERVIGSYKGKPLYQVTLPQVSMPNAPADGTTAQADIDISAYDVENVIDIEGWHTDGSTLSGVVNIAPGANSTVFVYHYHPSNGNFICLVNSLVGYNGRPTVITIRYTKTTDTVSPVEYAYPNDYSTSEKIVGSWIDGKPIYQKAIDVSSVVLATNQWVDTSISFTCETIIYSKAVWVSRQPSGSVAYQGQSVDVRCTSAGKLSLFTPYGNVNPDYIIVQYTKVS